MKKKAQSATEYLMTYGWAILAIAVVGGLLYSQVFSPQKCAGGATGFAITGTVYPDGNEYSIDTSGQLQILLKNTVGKDISLTSIDCPTGNIPFNPAENIADGDSRTITATGCTTGGTAGICYSAPIVFHYQTSAGIDIQAAGTLNGKY